MKLSLNWLKNYVNIPDSTDLQKLGELFTTRTAEVEEVYSLSSTFDNMVIGQIESIEPHPDADKLQVTKTNIGSKTAQIVCGAKNIFVGQKVAVALPGSMVKWHGEGDLIKLEPAKIRGVESFGMICAGEEIGIKDKTDGILDLSHLKVEAGTSLAEALNKNDWIIDIDNKALTHRPDCWGHLGIAREIAAITGQKLRHPELNKKYPSNPSPVAVEVKDKKLCPRYLTVTINNIKVEASPDWLKNALENTGNRSINNIVDATNFVMLELGNPLHAFDTAKINQKLIIRRAKKGEKITTLDNEEKTLDDSMLVIADQKRLLAIAGVKGGLDSGVSNETTSITLEAANFNPVSVRQTSVKVGIRTEAVQRFEKDLDPLLAETALDRLVKIIMDLCPEAEIVSQKTDVNNFKYKPRVIKLNLNRIESKIGVNVPATEIIESLEKLEFKILSKTKTALKVEVPSFRATKDINIEDDLVEEVARLFGYEKLPGKIPHLELQLPTINTERAEKHRIGQILSLENRFQECIDYSFYSLKNLQKAGLIAENHYQLKNYLSEEQTHLRTSLLPNLLTRVQQNLKYFSQFRIYEFGRTYTRRDDFFPLEEKQLTGLIVVEKNAASPFQAAAATVENLLNRLQISLLSSTRSAHPISYAHPAASASYLDPRNKKEIIRIFTLHPQVAKNFELENVQIAVFEINFTLLHQLPRYELKYQSINRFPSVQFDVSALYENTLEAAEIEKTVKKCSPLIKSVQLFDYYRGKNIAENKKSLAHKITLQATDRTLTDAEAKEVQQKVFENLKKLGAEIRGL